MKLSLKKLKELDCLASSAGRSATRIMQGSKLECWMMDREKSRKLYEWCMKNISHDERDRTKRMKEIMDYAKRKADEARRMPL